MLETNARLCDCGSGLRVARCCGWNPAQGGQAASRQLLAAPAAEAMRLKTAGDIEASEAVCRDVLDLHPGHLECLRLLAEIKAATTPRAAEALFARIVALDPDNLQSTCDLIILLIGRGAFAVAEPHARNAVRLAPEAAQPHNLLGILLTETNRPQAGEYHYRRALAYSGARDPMLLANLAGNLMGQGRMADARALYGEAEAAQPDALRILMGHARLEEADRDLVAAGALLDRCELLAPDNANVLLLRAMVHGRAGAYDAALATLDRIAAAKAPVGPSNEATPEGAATGTRAIATETAGEGSTLGANELLEKGRLLDKMGRYDLAFEAYVEGKAQARAMSGQSYMADAAATLARRLTGFFKRGRMGILPRATAGAGPQPIFVVGFPRSGTTLVEQILSSHSRISAGDELPFINEISNVMPRLLASPMVYPEALTELWMGDRHEALDDLRDHYLRQVRRYGVMEPGAAWFTDKMPLNETHLGLIHLLFPRSPILHVLRHPLDVITSVFSNHLTHGFFCSFALETAARHYALIADLVAHYRAELDLTYLAIRYEDIVDDPLASVETMLRFIGEPFEEQCLRFEENKRYARTASYAQVTEKLYSRSRYRYLKYRRHLEPVVPILRPAIERLGYTIEDA